MSRYRRADATGLREGTNSDPLSTVGGRAKRSENTLSSGLSDASDSVMRPGLTVCVECLVEKQNKTTLFKVTEPSSVPYRTPPACAKRAASSYPDPPLAPVCVECLIGK